MRLARATRGESGAGWVARRMVDVSRVRIKIESEQEG